MIKQWYHGLSITRKLRLVLTVVSMLAMICFGLMYTYVGVISLRGTLIASSENSTNIMGSALVASLRFANPDFGIQKLKELTPDASFKRICVYTDKGELFAFYPENLGCESKKPLGNGSFQEGTYKGDDGLVVERTIFADGQIVGAIQVVRSVEAINQYIVNQAQTMALIALASLVVCYIIAIYLQKIISKPIVDIATRAELISIMHNFDGKLLQQTSQDELGQIVRSFNSIVREMHSDNKELRRKYENIRRAHSLTLKKLEEIVDDFNEPADAFSVYTLFANKTPKESLQLEYHEDAMESLNEYHMRALSTSRISKLYFQSINEPLVQVGLQEYLLKYQHDIKQMLSNMPVEISGAFSPQEKLVIVVYKTAWDELFRMHAQLIASMAEIVGFPPKLHCTLVIGKPELILSLMSQNKKKANQQATTMKLCDLGIFESGTPYLVNSIQDPDAANEFLDDEILPRSDVQFILDSIAYIANANSISVKHHFDSGAFTIHLQLKMLASLESQNDYLEVCQ